MRARAAGQWSRPKSKRCSMGINDSQAKLTRAAKDLFDHWQGTKETWRDETSRQFEKKYLTPLQADLKTATQAMERIGAMIDRIRYDCK